MLEILLTLIKALFSPGFEDILAEIKENQRRAESVEIEKAKDAAQIRKSTGELQKELGKLTE